MLNWPLYARNLQADWSEGDHSFAGTAVLTVGRGHLTTNPIGTC